jgi:sugar phosphate isomerase/epimerase
MNRRQFARLVAASGFAAAGGLAAIGESREFQTPPPDQSFDVGLELYSLRREAEADLPATLAQVRAMGFREIEVPQYYGLTAAEFRKALDKTQLQAGALVAQWDVLEKGIGPIAADLAILGASWVILPWIPHGDRFERSDAARAAARMNAWASDFQKAGFRFAYHPLGYEFQPAPQGTLFDVLAANTDPAVSFEMDTFWIAWPGQDCVRLLNKYPHRFRLLHLKDLKKGVTGNLSGSAPDEDSVALGDGSIPWADVLSAARLQGCEKYYIEDESPDAAKQIPRSLDYLRSIRF